MSHSWLDSQQKRVLGCTALNSWNRNSSLREIVQIVLSGLQSGSQTTSVVISGSGSTTNLVQQTNYVSSTLPQQSNYASPSNYPTLNPQSALVTNEYSGGNPSNMAGFAIASLPSLQKPIDNQVNVSIVDNSPKTAMPEIPSNFPELKEKSEFELEAYLHDFESFKVLCIYHFNIH